MFRGIPCFISDLWGPRLTLVLMNDGPKSYVKASKMLEEGSFWYRSFSGS